MRCENVGAATTFMDMGKQIAQQQHCVEIIMTSCRTAENSISHEPRLMLWSHFYCLTKVVCSMPIFSNEQRPFSCPPGLTNMNWFSFSESFQLTSFWRTISMTHSTNFIASQLSPFQSYRVSAVVKHQVGGINRKNLARNLHENSLNWKVLGLKFHATKEKNILNA